MTNTYIRNILLLSISLFYACSNLNTSNHTVSLENQSINEYNLDSLLMNKINKTDEEWKKMLSAQEFEVTRKKGTERSFTGEYHDSKQKGVYHCKCCDMPLFLSDNKFDSGTGWPSFYQTFDPVCISEHKDFTHGMIRTEVTCARCEAHLGHLFPDGPNPTGLRYCINSISLVLKDK